MNMFDRIFRKQSKDSEVQDDQDKCAYSAKSQLTPQEAQDYWAKLAQKLAVGAINSVDYTAERIFILVSFDEKEPTIDMFFQMDGQLRMWNDLDNEDYKKVISQSLVSQAPIIAKQVNCLYD
ncbi:hypothetical protein BU052_14625, partial [Staphylococcus simulans]